MSWRRARCTRDFIPDVGDAELVGGVLLGLAVEVDAVEGLAEMSGSWSTSGCRQRGKVTGRLVGPIVGRFGVGPPVIELGERIV